MTTGSRPSLPKADSRDRPRLVAVCALAIDDEVEKLPIDANAAAEAAVAAYERTLATDSAREIDNDARTTRCNRKWTMYAAETERRTLSRSRVGIGPDRRPRLKNGGLMARMRKHSALGRVAPPPR